MPESTIQFKDELVIRGGQVFNREVFESPVGDIEKLLEEACIPASSKFIPLQFPSLLRNEWCVGHWFGVTPKNEMLVITEIQYIPFPDTHIVKSGDNYTLCFSPIDEVPSSHWEPQEGNPPIRFRMDNCPKWYPPERARLFILYQQAARQSSAVPMLFMLHDDHVEPIVPKIPNVFQTGDICTGRTFNSVCDAATGTFEKAKVALDAIRIAPANHDLRENDSDFIQWTINTENPPVQLHVPWQKTFGRNATDSRILEFTKMIRS